MSDEHELNETPTPEPDAPATPDRPEAPPEPEAPQPPEPVAAAVERRDRHGAVVTGHCGLYWDNTLPHVQGCGVDPTMNGNLIADPLFCDPDARNFMIRSDSPASPEHPSGCGLRGALCVGCGPVSIEPESWARIKQRYFRARE